MYLKNIEVHGFKSFANKINFEFHNGITGIVGPNGSGKSNVADAVRWVLGEQRIKQLRGASMQDVIFSGTELRKPLGYAYVAITLDNADHQLAIDYDEVTVSRRIYRSGESEYMINGTVCRLKDVNELFYDTGIGKEGYSIIGQGQIDRILSGKPEERRELFDEAAGIVKFKRRKASAQKKLEDEKQNLVRVKDILSELEKQVGPLEKQSEKAKVYLKKKEELKNYDVNVFLLDNQKLSDQNDELEQKIQVSQEDYESASEQHTKIREEYDQVQNTLEELEQSINAARDTLADTGLKRGRLEGEINVLKEQIKAAESNEEQMQERVESIQKDISLKQAELDQISQEKKAIDDQVQLMQETRDLARKALETIQNRIENLNTKIEEGKNKIIGALSDRADIQSQLASNDAMMEQMKIRKAELNSRLLRVKSNEAEQDVLIKSLEEEFAAITQQITDSNQKIQSIDGSLNELKTALSKKDEEIQKQQQLYHQDKSKLDTISNLTERYEGYSGSIQKVMQEKARNKGIIGVVADIIKAEKKYETAIETALGGNIQNIVTDNEETAKKMIEVLKRSKSGRATFLPLTSITKPQEFKTPEVLKEKGVIGMADALVNTKAEYKNVAKAMLGRIVVIDHIDHAVQIARKFDYGVRMVTLEGELLVPGGAISGGAFRNNSNLLGRRRELDELENKVKESKEKMDSLQAEMDEIRNKRNDLRREFEQEKENLQTLFIKQNTARLNVSKAEERKREASQGFDDLKTEELDIEKQVREIEEGKAQIKEKLSNSEVLEKEVNEAMKVAQNELEEARKEESIQTAKTSEWDVETEKLLQKQEFENTNVSRIEAELQKYKDDLANVVHGFEYNKTEIEQKRQHIEELQKTMEASYNVQDETELQLKQNVAKKEELTEKQKQFFKNREELSERVASLDKELFRLNSQKQKISEQMDNSISYMWNEYEITLRDAQKLRNEELNDLSAMKKEIFKIKEEIKALGSVNVNAIEDYKNIMERYEFLKKQHDDLIEAEKTLQGIIEELDSAMRKQFTEKFAEICTEFDKVFKELFGGGKGTLELMEDEDILEAGIKINAQPPGKKLQNMMQLSGGEKALAAIALLFSIQNLKPSPFCLLDEIEAALDENNVGRFAKYLHKLTKNTQFIVITHRRGTMEQVDRLYGITMQEKGVSTLVSVNLIDKDLDN